MMDASNWIGLFGGIAGIAGAIATVGAYRKAGEANRIASEANSVALEANRLSGAANSLSSESNQIAHEANDIARKAMDSQMNSDKLAHAASLVLLPDFPGIDDQQPSGRFIRVPLTNIGAVDAYDVTIRVRCADSTEWHSSDGPVGIRAGKRADFRLRVRPDLFREREGSPVIDYRVTYKDLMDHHEKWFRLQLSGQWDTNWSFRLLDIKLDGKRVTFPNAPELAPGIAYVEDQAR